jgi:FkbM family methyltransferase
MLNQLKQTVKKFTQAPLTVEDPQDIARTWIKNSVMKMPDDVLLWGTMNDIYCQIPIEFFRRYPTGLFPMPHDVFYLHVEYQLATAMCEHLKPGDAALEIGASIGGVVVRLSNHVGSSGKVYAFEPARDNRRVLENLITANNLQNVTVVPMAISDEVGEAEFIEYERAPENTWAADRSSLITDQPPIYVDYNSYKVAITTLDSFVSEHNIQPRAIKIDIEGFELYALKGGVETLKKYKPFLAIDIHVDVRTKVSALEAVTVFLESLGYEISSWQHILFAVAK